MNKSVRIDKLIELRRRYFAKDIEAKGRLEAAARKAFGEKYPDLASDSSLVVFSDKMYCLSNLERYKGSNYIICRIMNSKILLVRHDVTS